jgi:hypothetical protein
VSAVPKIQVGEHFGRLVVVGQISDRGRFVCRCHCGRVVEVVAAKLLSGHTRSCGCLKRELAIERLDAAQRRREATAEARRRKRGAWPYATPGCRKPAGRGITGAFCAAHAAHLAEIREKLEHEPAGRPVGPAPDEVAA